MTLAGCATTDYVPVDCPEPLPIPAAPAQAMEHARDRSQLPADFVSLPLEEALRTLLRAHTFDMGTLDELEAKHSVLVDYIMFILEAEAEDGS